MLPPHRPFRNKPARNVILKKKRNLDAKVLSGKRFRDLLDQQASLVVLGRQTDTGNTNNA